MLTISLMKILSRLLLPPGILVWILLVSAFYFYKRGIRIAFYTNMFVAGLFYLTFTEPFQDFLYRKLEEGLEPVKPPITGDVIIVLGGGIYENSPDISGRSVPSDEALSRIVMAYRLYKTMNVPIIVAGGRLTEESITEAEVAKRFLLDFGVSEKDIILESNSRTTQENALYSKKIIEKMGFKKAVLVTSAYHIKRALLCFKLYNVDVIPAPCSFRAINKTNYQIFNYFPGPANPFPQLNELLGILYVKIRLMINY